MITDLYKYKNILYRTTITEIRQKYAGSLMGLFWLLLWPLFLMVFYSVIYLVVFKFKPLAMSEYEYVLYILTGLIPFLGFSESLNVGTSSLAMNKAVLLNTVFPAELVPLRAVLASQGTTVVGLAIILLISTAMGKISWLMLFVPIIMMLLVLFVMGIVWVLSLANLVMRDIQHALAFVSMTLLIVSPIAYTVDMVSGPLKLVIYLNPLSYFIIALHEIIVFERMPSLFILAFLIILPLLSLLAGYWVFNKAKSVFFDYA